MKIKHYYRESLRNILRNQKTSQIFKKINKKKKYIRFTSNSLKQFILIAKLKNMIF